MSQKGKFNVPFRSPAARGQAQSSVENRTPQSDIQSEVSYFASPWLDEGRSISDGQKTIEEPLKHVKPKNRKKCLVSEKKCTNNKSMPSTQTPKLPSRTPVFQLYGVKSPYKRQHPANATPGALRYSFMSSQASSPGISPARLIKNFSEKIKAQEGVACEKGDVLEEDEVRGGENTNMCEDMPANQSPVLAVVVTKKKNTVVHDDDVYDMELSLEPVPDNIRPKRLNERQKVKQVLAVIRKMHKEFRYYQQKYESLFNRNANQVLEANPQDTHSTPVTSVELMYSCTQSQAANTQNFISQSSTSQEREKLYSEAKFVAGLSQGNTVPNDLTEE